jgi:glycosyltransferase involved in cell wall biosynthesis
VISVLIPSRERPELLARSVTSLRDKAASPPEVLVAADDDDDTTVKMALELGVQVVVVMPRVGYDRIHEYYHEMAARASGSWLMVWDDDAVMLTPRWDEVIEALPREVYVADVQSPYSPMCCYPAVRRQAVAALGKFSTDNPHVDTFWQDVGVTAGIISRAEVHADCTMTVKPDRTHGFYEPAHQAELAVCAALLRQELGS